MPAKGTAEWKGDLRSGTGTFTAGDSISGGIYVQVTLLRRALASVPEITLEASLAQ